MSQSLLLLRHLQLIVAAGVELPSRSQLDDTMSRCATFPRGKHGHLKVVAYACSTWCNMIAAMYHGYQGFSDAPVTPRVMSLQLILHSMVQRCASQCHGSLSCATHLVLHSTTHALLINFRIIWGNGQLFSTTFLQQWLCVQEGPAVAEMDALWYKFKSSHLPCMDGPQLASSPNPEGSIKPKRLRRLPRYVLAVG